MILKAKLKDVFRDWDTGRFIITLVMEEGNITDINKYFNGHLSVDIRRWRNRRSLDSNAYCWELLSRMAEALKSDKEFVYREMLQKYSTSFTHIICKEKAIPKLREMYRCVIDLGEITVGNMTGHQLQVYFGSSTFNSKEMSTFIDGIVSECKELGIETLPPSEIERMNKEWGSQS